MIHNKDSIQTWWALMTQQFDTAPTVIMLYNTLGDIVWTRLETGIYIGTSAGLFKGDKTSLTIGNPTTSMTTFRRLNDNQIQLNTYTMVNVAQDFLLNRTPVKIEIFNQYENYDTQ